MREPWMTLAPNVPIRDGRRDVGGETTCPARERDGTRCAADSGMWSYAHLCERHSRMVQRRMRVVLVNGTTLVAGPWVPARRLGMYLPALTLAERRAAMREAA